jgi:hypothetical protein
VAFTVIILILDTVRRLPISRASAGVLPSRGLDGLP